MRQVTLNPDTLSAEYVDQSGTLIVVPLASRDDIRRVIEQCLSQVSPRRSTHADLLRAHQTLGLNRITNLSTLPSSSEPIGQERYAAMMGLQQIVRDEDVDAMPALRPQPHSIADRCMSMVYDAQDRIRVAMTGVKEFIASKMPKESPPEVRPYWVRTTG